MNQAIAMSWQMLQRGNAAAAEEVIQSLLMGGVISDEVVPLLGAIRLQQNRHADAVPLFARARASAPREARFAFLHGMALAGLGRLTEATAAFQDAIRREPTASAPYLALGDAQRKLGQWDNAQSTFRKLLRREPENVDALMALSAVLADTGDPAQAEGPLRRAFSHAIDPRTKVALHNNLAVVLGAQNRHQEALESLEAAQALIPDMPDMDNRCVNILYQMGRYEDCVALYEKLLAKNPADPATHRAYNSLLYRLGRTAQYLTSYDRAPKTRELMLAKAETLWMEKRGAEALDIFGELLARDPGDAAAQTGRAGCLMQMGRLSEAVAAFETAIAHAQPDTAMYCGAAQAALMAGDADKAEYFCQTRLRDAPFDQTCLALLSTAWRLKGDARDEDLNGYDSLIQVFDLAPPEGFSSMEDFNAELAAFLETIHPDTREYLEQSLRGGTQTEGFLFNSGNALIQKLKMRIDEAMEDFIAALKPEEYHPFTARRRDSFAYAGAWSSRMKDCGFHVNHIHPQGWISSCYYVAVPGVTKDQNARQGWIKFGEPELEVGLKDPVRRAVQPVPGRLVLFPSYMWHGTVPFQDNAVRATIAFDAVPR
jgi:tetratricopeptide (TPR) repeat protein